MKPTWTNSLTLIDLFPSTHPIQITRLDWEESAIAIR